MENKKKFVTDKIIGAGFILYFIILFIERMVGGIAGLFVDGPLGCFGNDGSYFGFISNFVAIGMALVGLSLSIRPMVRIFKTLFGSKPADYEYKDLLFASFFMLLSGMMHTGLVIGGLQFTAYGFLIVALIAVTVNGFSKENGASSILSLLYLVFFSMCVAVVYPPLGEDLFSGLGIGFVVLEIVSALITDFLFHLLAYYFFMNNGRLNFNLGSLLIMVVLDAAIIVLSFVFGIPDIFVLIFVVLSIVSYIVGAIVSRKGKALKINPLDNSL